MEERAWWTTAAVLAFGLAFAVISALVWASRGRSYPLLKAKLRLGGLLLGLTAVAAGCGEKEDSMVMCYDAGWDSDAYNQPDIDVDMDSMDFGMVYVGETGTITLTIDSIGNGPLTISAIGVTDDAGVFTVSNTGPIELTAGGQAQVEVSFTPTDAVDYTGTIIIDSDDPSDPSVEVELLGAGLVV